MPNLPTNTASEAMRDLLLRTNALCTEVVQGGKHAAHNAANLLNHINLFLQQTAAAAPVEGKMPNPGPLHPADSDAYGAPDAHPQLAGEEAVAEIIRVLRGGRQCDEDGVEIIMSRQACVEAADLLEEKFYLPQSPAVERLAKALERAPQYARMCSEYSGHLKKNLRYNVIAGTAASLLERAAALFAACSHIDIRVLIPSLAGQTHSAPGGDEARTIYDHRSMVQRCAERAGPQLYVALKNLLDAVKERNGMRESIESIVLSDAESALAAAIAKDSAT